MGGNYFITKAAVALGGGKEQHISLENAKKYHLPKNENASSNNKLIPVSGAFDIGCRMYSLSRSSSYEFGSIQFYLEVITRLFTSTVLPILHAFPGIHLTLCLDGCTNDLKEFYKEKNLPEEKYQRRKASRDSVYASNLLFTSLINKVAPALLAGHQDRCKVDTTLPDLKNATVTAVIGPQEADDAITVVLDTLIEKSGLVILFYDDNDNVVSGAGGNSTAFQASKFKDTTTLVCVNKLTVNAQGELRGTMFSLLDVCACVNFHPQILPVLAAIIKHDKSPGWPGIGEKKIWELSGDILALLVTEEYFSLQVEEKLTIEFTKKLLERLVEDETLQPLENEEATKERIHAIAEGAVDSVRGLPDFFKEGNESLLLRSQRGNCSLKKVSSSPHAVFHEIQAKEYYCKALGDLDSAAVLRDDVASEIANRCLDIGIVKSATEEYAPHVAAMCKISSSSASDYYINSNARLSNELDKIGRGIVRRLNGYVEVSGTLSPVLFLIKSVNNGYGISVVPRLETSTSADTYNFIAPSVPGNAYIGLNQGLIYDSDSIDADNRALEAPIQPDNSYGHGAATLTSDDMDSSGSDAVDTDSEFSDFTDESDDLEDLYLLLSDDDEPSDEEEVEKETSGPAAEDFNEMGAAELLDLIRKPKIALLVLNVAGANSLVLWSDDSSFPPSGELSNGDAGNILTHVIEDAYVNLVSKCGTLVSVSSPLAISRTNVNRRNNDKPVMFFGEYSCLAKALRNIKSERPELFDKKHSESDRNLLHLDVNVDGKLCLFCFSVPEKLPGNVQAQIKASCLDLSDSNAAAIEFGLNGSSCLIATLLEDSVVRLPPWKVHIPEFCQTAVRDCVPALIGANSFAVQKMAYPFGNNLCEGYFCVPATRSPECMLDISRLDSPLRRAVSKAYATAVPPIGERPVPIAILLLPSKVVIAGVIKYDPTLPKEDLFIKVREDVLTASGILFGAQEHLLYFGTGENEQYGKLITISHQSVGEDIKDDDFEPVQFNLDAEEAVKNSLAVGMQLKMVTGQSSMDGTGILGQFKFNQAKGSVAGSGQFGLVISALLEASAATSPEIKGICVKFARPDAVGVTTVLHFKIEVCNSRKVGEFRDRDNSQKRALFLNKNLQVGIVSGSNTMQLGLQFATGKRDEAGHDDGKVPVAWEQRSLSLMEVLRLVIGALVVKPSSVFLNSAIAWLRSNRYISQEEMELGEDDDNLFFEGLFV